MGFLWAPPVFLQNGLEHLQVLKVTFQVLCKENKCDARSLMARLYMLTLYKTGLFFFCKIMSFILSYILYLFKRLLCCNEKLHEGNNFQSKYFLYLRVGKKRWWEKKFFEVVKQHIHWNTFNIALCEKNPCHHTQLINSFYQLVNLMFLYTVKHYIKDYKLPFIVWKHMKKFLTNTVTAATVSLILKLIQ